MKKFSLICCGTLLLGSLAVRADEYGKYGGCKYGNVGADMEFVRVRPNPKRGEILAFESYASQSLKVHVSVVKTQWNDGMYGYILEADQTNGNSIDVVGSANVYLPMKWGSSPGAPTSAELTSFATILRVNGPSDSLFCGLKIGEIRKLLP